MSTGVWQEFDYSQNICDVIKCTYIDLVSFFNSIVGYLMPKLSLLKNSSGTYLLIAEEIRFMPFPK